jgi:hypothetical protein
LQSLRLGRSSPGPARGLSLDLLLELVFGAGAPWGFVLGVNAVYALAAWAVYRVIAPAGGGHPAAATT